MLATRPDVFAPPGDTTFFSGTESLAGYRNRFSDWRGERIRIDLSTASLMPRTRPALTSVRIDALLAGVKVVAVVRDPVCRAAQAFERHRMQGRVPSSRTFSEHLRTIDPRLDPLEVVAAGEYATVLKPFVRVFGERLHVIFEEDLVARPLRVWSGLLAFIGCDVLPSQPLHQILELSPARLPWDLPGATPDDRDRELTAAHYAPANADLASMVAIPPTVKWSVAT